MAKCINCNKNAYYRHVDNERKTPTHCGACKAPGMIHHGWCKHGRHKAQCKEDECRANATGIQRTSGQLASLQAKRAHHFDRGVADRKIRISDRRCSAGVRHDVAMLADVVRRFAIAHHVVGIHPDCVCARAFV